MTTTHYCDIHVRADAQTGTEQVLSSLFASLHSALVRAETTSVGVTFPGYDLEGRKLGTTLRLSGPNDALLALRATGWPQNDGLEDEVDVLPVTRIPVSAVHRTLSRVQTKWNGVDRIRRRAMRRHNLTWDQARLRIPETAPKYLDLPRLHVLSASTKQAFMMYLRLGEPSMAPVEGEFNAYGLSSTATMPWF